MYFLTIFFTVISGTLVFVLGQIFVEFVLRPTLEYRKLKRKVVYNLYYYSNRLTNFQMCYEDFNSLRELAAELKSYSYERPWWIKGEAIEDSIEGLLGLSNSGGADIKFISEMVDKVENALGSCRKNV